MKFYNRTNELEILKRNNIQSEKSACFTVMVGHRRIGKTSVAPLTTTFTIDRTAFTF